LEALPIGIYTSTNCIFESAKTRPEPNLARAKLSLRQKPNLAQAKLVPNQTEPQPNLALVQDVLNIVIVVITDVLDVQCLL
jgi:hypothetical protein